MTPWVWILVAIGAWAWAVGQWLTFFAYLKRRRRIREAQSREFADWYVRHHARPRQ